MTSGRRTQNGRFRAIRPYNVQGRLRPEEDRSDALDDCGNILIEVVESRRVCIVQRLGRGNAGVRQRSKKLPKFCILGCGFAHTRPQGKSTTRSYSEPISMVKPAPQRDVMSGGAA